MQYLPLPSVAQAHSVGAGGVVRHRGGGAAGIAAGEVRGDAGVRGERAGAGVGVRAAAAAVGLEPVASRRASLEARVKAAHAGGRRAPALDRVRTRAEHVGGDAPRDLAEERVRIGPGVRAVGVRSFVGAVGAGGRLGLAAGLVGAADAGRAVRADVAERGVVVGADARRSRWRRWRPRC